MSRKTGKHNEIDNPCFKEHNMSMKCLNDYGYDRDKCEDYFDNYNSCKKFWGKVESDRRMKGISPNMPDYEERKKILAERAAYLKSLNI